MSAAPKRDVTTIELRADSLASSAFSVVHYQDAYQLALAAGAPDDVDALARLLTSSSPAWVGRLMSIRDRAASVAGLKRSRTAPRAPQTTPFEVGDRAGIFVVYARTADELLAGGDDRHLDFRVSMLLQRQPQGRTFVVSTVVHYNNLLGRAYFTVVRPFHRLIVPATLRAIRRRLESPDGGGAT